MLVKPLKLVYDMDNDHAVPCEGPDLDGYLIPGSAVPSGSEFVEVTWFDLAVEGLCRLDMTRMDYARLGGGDGGRLTRANPFTDWRWVKLVQVADGPDHAVLCDDEKDLDGFMFPGSAQASGGGWLSVLWFDLAFHDLSCLDVTQAEYTELCAGVHVCE